MKWWKKKKNKRKLSSKNVLILLLGILLRSIRSLVMILVSIKIWLSGKLNFWILVLTGNRRLLHTLRKMWENTKKRWEFLDSITSSLRSLNSMKLWSRGMISLTRWWKSTTAPGSKQFPCLWCLILICQQNSKWKSLLEVNWLKQKKDLQVLNHQ